MWGKRMEQIDVGARVAAAILENGKIGHAVIEVEDRDGNITLRGNAATERDRRAAERVASSQQGVVQVINKIVCG